MANFLISEFACPHCRSPLEQSDQGELYCMADGLIFLQREGIWRMLLPERAKVFEQFIEEYETIRRSEGRGSNDPNYYLSLPYLAPNQTMAKDWRVRATSYNILLKKMIESLEVERGKNLNIVDLGAGNCWLTYRLAERGHRLAAVDLLVNDFDGLGCRDRYPVEFSSVQAEFDRLPFVNSCADLVIFNASFHYSMDFRATLREALRVLADDGSIVILDSPVYHNRISGEQMVIERQAQFCQKFGFASNSIPSQNYLTYQRLEELGGTLHVGWQLLTPNYGIRWIMRPWLAALSGRREPAKFHLIIGRKTDI